LEFNKGKSFYLDGKKAIELCTSYPKEL